MQDFRKYASSANMLPNGRTADVSKIEISKELRQRIFDQAIWDDWCRVFKSTVYWGA